MKKLVLAFVLFFIGGYTYAANLVSGDLLEKQRNAPSYPTVDTYVSTMIAVQVTSATVIISSYPCVLRTLSINQYGSPDSRVEIFDASFSTFAPESMKLFDISTSSFSVFTSAPWNVYCSSGLGVYITGTILPNVTPVWRRK